MGFKLVSYEVPVRTGGTFTTRSQFRPLSVALRGEVLFLHGMQSDNREDEGAPERPYDVVIYGDGDRVDDEFQEKFVGPVDLPDPDSGRAQRLHVFCRWRA